MTDPFVDTERPFRIRPRAPKRSREDARAWPMAFRRVLHIFQMTSKAIHRKAASAHRSAARRVEPRKYAQRCAVRITYSPNRVKGQWAAHGRYLVRESAVLGDEIGGRGFDGDSRAVDVVAMLRKWQDAGDERMFKMILSPEFGERMDLERLTRELMERMASDLGMELEWVAVAHFNTEHPHVHVAVRGVSNGVAFRLSPDYVKNGIRRHAEDLCTAQLGYRTAADISETQHREIEAQRFTSLDRVLARQKPADAGRDFEVSVNSSQRILVARLHALESMGLADGESGPRWRVQSDFEHVLRSMQQATDRQRMLAASAALLSDERLPLQLTPVHAIQHIEGRVLGHILDDSTGRVQMLLEGTDAKVHFIPHDGALESARANGQLKPNSFVALDRAIRLTITDHGDAESYLDSEHLKRTARLLVQRGMVPAADAWGGWLGRYMGRLAVEGRPAHEPVRPQSRQFG